MDGFPSGQREQTVNLPAPLSVVRIHPRPPRKVQGETQYSFWAFLCISAIIYFVIFVYKAQYLFWNILRIKFINLCRITQTYTEEPGTPKTIDELFAGGNEEYVDIVSDTLNDNLYEKIIKKAIGNDYDIAKVCDAIWEITDDDMGNINNVRIFFFYNYANNSRTYCIESVKPKTIISVKDLINPSVEDLDKAFDTTVRGGAKYTQEYVFSFNPSIQEARKELKDAVKKSLQATA